MKKILILDTSVLLTDFKSLFYYGVNDICIPLIVLEELDKNKNRPDIAGRHARAAIRILDQLRAKAQKKKTDITTGIKIRRGCGMLHTCYIKTDLLPVGFDKTIPDHQIIGTALYIRDNNPNHKVIVVSNDINMRVKCNSVGLLSEEFVPNKVVKTKTELYSGFAELDVSSNIIDNIFKQEEVDLPVTENSIHPNQFLELTSSTKLNHKALVRYNGKGKGLKTLAKSVKTSWGVSPKNREQLLAWDLLTDKNIPIVSLIGKAGSGKTLISLAAALEQVINKKEYDRLIVSRPIQPMGRDLGYLPGTIEEKLDPWLAPVKDNLLFLFGNDKESVKEYMERGIIEVEALTYIRGRSIQNSILLLDESQNLTRHEMKTILTRVGMGSKIILTGDIEQIDNSNIDEISNGLTYVIEKFKDLEIAGHITLVKGERSEVATVSAELL